MHMRARCHLRMNLGVGTWFSQSFLLLEPQRLSWGPARSSGIPDCLPKRERAPDRRANEIALELFGKALDQLDKVSFTRVLLTVKREFTGREIDDDPTSA